MMGDRKNAGKPGAKPSVLKAVSGINKDQVKGKTFTLDEMRDALNDQKTSCCYSGESAREEDLRNDMWHSYNMICSPYCNPDIYPTTEIDCPHHHAGALPIARAFYAVHSGLRFVHWMYGKLCNLLYNSKFAGIKLGLYTNKWRLRPSTFMQIPFNMRGITVGSIQGIYYTCSNLLRQSVWGYDFDKFISAEVFRHIE